MKALVIYFALLMPPAMCSAQVYVVMQVQRTTNHTIAVSMPTPGQESWWPAGTHTVDRACAIIRDAWHTGGQGNSIDVGIVAKDVRFEDYYPLIKAMAESEAKQFELLYVSGMQNGYIPDLIRKEQQALNANATK